MRGTCVRFAKTSRSAELSTWLRAQELPWRDQQRHHVASEELCENALKLLEATLPAPQSCDIIDINPGTCVWSKVLHDKLKPRRHILVEPAYQVFQKFLDPLLKQQRSVYRHAPDLLTALKEDNDLLSPETVALAVREKAQRPSGMLKNCFENKTLLITANLSRHGKRTLGFSGTEAKRFLNNWYRSLRNTEGYMHQYGLVRLLAWVDDNTRSTIMPTSITQQTKQAIQFDTAFETTQVVGPHHYVGSGRFTAGHRWFELDVENLRQVEETQAQHGITIPAHRQPAGPNPPIGFYEPKTSVLAANRSKLSPWKLFVDRYLAMEQELLEKNPEFLARCVLDAEARSGKRRVGRGPNVANGGTETEKQFRLMSSKMRYYHYRYMRDRDFVHNHRTLWRRLYQAAQPVSRDVADVPDESGDGNGNANVVEDSVNLTERLQQQYAKLEEETNKVGGKDGHILIQKATDDYRAHDSNPRTLAFNDRTFEPLIAYPQDFAPATTTKKPLTLLSIQPRLSFIHAIDTFDKQICFDHVITQFMMNQADTVHKGLSRLVPAGTDQFIASIDGLTDITQGGWHNLHHMRIRTLHREFLIKIALAYERWPFRPGVEKLIKISRTALDDQPEIGGKLFH